MNNLPTAEEYLDNRTVNDPYLTRSVVQSMMIEFAKLHVQKALKKASEEVEFDDKVLIRQSILQAYPLELIK